MMEPVIVPEAYFSSTEQEALGVLRARYRERGDLFSDREYARLLFMRWLTRQSGREHFDDVVVVEHGASGEPAYG